MIYNTTYWLQWANEQVCIDSKIARSCNIKFYLSVSDQLVDVEKSRCASVKLPINRRYRKDTASTPRGVCVNTLNLKKAQWCMKSLFSCDCQNPFPILKIFFDCYWCLLPIMDVHVTNIERSKKLVVKYWWNLNKEGLSRIYFTNIDRNDVIDISYSQMVVKD